MGRFDRFLPLITTGHDYFLEKKGLLPARTKHATPFEQLLGTLVTFQRRKSMTQMQKLNWAYRRQTRITSSPVYLNIRQKTFIWLLSIIKTESTRKLSNFKFEWTNTLYQNNFKNLKAYCIFFTFFRGLRCSQSSVVTPKKLSYGSPRK